MRDDFTENENKIQKFEHGAMEALSFLALAWQKEIKDFITPSRDEAVKLMGQQSARLFDDKASIYDTLG